MEKTAPKCGKCGQHPRTRIHAEQCIIPSGRTPIIGGVVGRVVRKAGSTRMAKRTRAKVASVSVAPDPKGLPENWVLGQTCLTCKTTYTQTPFPQFQVESAKHGQYDVTRQLPGTSQNYPQCEHCLPWFWRTEAQRLGVQEQFEDVYAGYFR